MLKGKKRHISGHENEFGGLHLAMHRELIATIACFIKLYPRLSFLATPGYPLPCLELQNGWLEK
jgi:hypothetical protein